MSCSSAVKAVTVGMTGSVGGAGVVVVVDEVVAGEVVVGEVGEVTVIGVEVGWLRIFFKETTLPLLLLGCPILTDWDWMGVGF